MKLTNKWIAAAAALALVLSMLPMGMTVIAAPQESIAVIETPSAASAQAISEARIEVTTWDELRDALQSPQTLTVEVSEGTVIEHVFNAATEYIDHENITVVGKKTLALYGEIRFYNGLQTGGLFNLTSGDADLTIAGHLGTILYDLYDEANNITWYGDMFYLTDGKLTLAGNANLIVDYQYTDPTSKVHQAVVGGTGGSVIVNYAFLQGNTIFGDGIDFTFKNGSVRGVYGGTKTSYKNVDLFMTAGKATFEGCRFERGLATDGDVTKLLKKPSNVLCIDRTDKTENADKEGILTNCPCAFYQFGLSKMSPEMPDGSTLCNVGTLGIGETVRIDVQGIRQNTGLGKELIDYLTLEVYRDGEKLSDLTVNTYANKGVFADFNNVKAGVYDVFITHALKQDDVTLRKVDYDYRVTVTNEIRHVDVLLDKSDMSSLQTEKEFADVSNIVWYEKSRTGSGWTQNPSTLRDGNTYAVEFSVLSIGGKYPFGDGYTVSINGEPATALGGGRWRYEYTKTGYLTRIEMYDIRRPAPGQTPDFTAHKDNPPYSSYEVVWTPYVDGEYGEPMTANDTFEADTYYLLEVILTAEDDFEFDYSIDGAYAYINNQEARIYYPTAGDHTKIAAYLYYHTSDCISQIELTDVQYPIAGKTPDTDVVIPWTDDVRAVSYANGSQLNWYYETNPGTASAGFSKLDGKFKADRRHQAYVTLETYDDCWFATDKNGNLAVSVTFDGKPMAFAYSTDSYLDDGACNMIEAARTFERAQDVDGVFVDGMWLTDGLYMDNSQWGVQTEQTVNKAAGYAYYNNGVLTLHDFEWTAQGDYNMIDSYNPLIIKLEGQSYLATDKIGIASNDTLTLTGGGTLELYSDERGIFAMDDVTVNSGNWYIIDTQYEGMWLYSSLTVNGGMLDVYGKDGGLYGDDYPPVTINGGTVIARADDGYAIGWCDMHIANGATVLVAPSFDGANAVKWDGQTDFIDYSYVEIAFESTVLLGDVTGDGAVNMLDVLALYNG
ncbi:MAG: carbohydrate-binding domain-containing protein, partial [Clostridia bacterium]|nr:carbohydrate-binding domain-containing protein [Clostridia bacterium]